MPFGRGRLAAGVFLAALLAGCGSAGSSTASRSMSTAAGPSSAVLPSFAANPSVSPAADAADAIVVIDGVEYTCDELMGDPGTGCNEALQAYFARWADNMTAYLEAEPVVAARQVVLPPLSDGEVLLYGLIACGATEVATEAGTQTVEVVREFEDHLLGSRPGSDTDAIDDLFYEAVRILCPDVELITGG